MPEERYEGWQNRDTWAVNLYVKNESDFYFGEYTPMVQWIRKHRAKGNYDEARAKAGLLKIAKQAAREARKSGNYGTIDNRRVNWDELVNSWLENDVIGHGSA